MPTSSSLPDPVLETHVLWHRHQKTVMAAIVIALVALVGYGGYRLYLDRQDKAAAAMLASAKTGPDFQKIITQYSGAPASASATIFLAGEQRKEKKFTEANATLQAFITKHPKHELVGIARMAMAANLESLGKADEALTMYQRLAADNPQSFTAGLALMATVPLLKEKKQIDEARRVCESIITQYRGSAVALVANQQLSLLKGGNGPSPSAATPPAVTGPIQEPSVSSVTISGPIPLPVQPPSLPSAVAPPAPSSSKPAVSPVKKP